MYPKRLLILAVIVMLTVAACGGEEEDPTATPTEEPTVATEALTEEEAEAEPTEAANEDAEVEPTEAADEDASEDSTDEEPTAVADAGDTTDEEDAAPPLDDEALPFGNNAEDGEAPSDILDTLARPNIDDIQYLEEEQRWLAASLIEGGPLVTAGLQEGDIITAVDGEAFTPDDIAPIAQSMDGTDTVTLTIERDGEPTELDISVDTLVFLEIAYSVSLSQTASSDAPNPFENAPMPPVGGVPGNVGDGLGALGFNHAPITEELAEENDLENTDGAIVTDIREDSNATEAGLVIGDIIISVNGADLEGNLFPLEILNAGDPGETVTLGVLRDGEIEEISYELEAVTTTNLPFDQTSGFPPAENAEDDTAEDE